MRETLGVAERIFRSKSAKGKGKAKVKPEPEPELDIGEAFDDEVLDFESPGSPQEPKTGDKRRHEYVASDEDVSQQPEKSEYDSLFHNISY
jgi:hypothetical protein